MSKREAKNEAARAQFAQFKPAARVDPTLDAASTNQAIPAEKEAALEKSRAVLLKLAAYGRSAPNMIVCAEDGMTYGDALHTLTVIQSLIAACEERSAELEVAQRHRQRYVKAIGLLQGGLHSIAGSSQHYPTVQTAMSALSAVAALPRAEGAKG